MPYFKYNTVFRQGLVMTSSFRIDLVLSLSSILKWLLFPAGLSTRLGPELLSSLHSLNGGGVLYSNGDAALPQRSRYTIIDAPPVLQQDSMWILMVSCRQPIEQHRLLRRPAASWEPRLLAMVSLQSSAFIVSRRDRPWQRTRPLNG